jgi:hypothetical protein
LIRARLIFAVETHGIFLHWKTMSQAVDDLVSALQAQGVNALDAIEVFAATLGEESSIYLLALVALARK